ncbi:MAG: T9SS type A sorting domain-containing protein [Bacteroidales bacterium]|nr:T9SS type A sorting domain-containing protein [Bacteroidales bacterium]
MKTKLTISLMSFALLVVFNFSRLQAQTPGSIEMGPQYANEVFFSLTTGVVKVSPRNIWDIAFYTNAFSAGIITNDGAGVELYTYPNADKDGWDSFDTTGFSGWNKMYNDPSDWENGAFNRNQKGHPDYGWGVYSATSHDVIGDSLFLVKTPDGIFRKLNIVRKYSSLNKYEIRFSLLDGQQDQTVTLDVNPYVDKAFMAYSFTTGIVDREPAAASWDILFTKYYGVVQNTPYPVVGVLLNPVVKAARVAKTDPAFTDWTNLDFETGSDIIGHDWKYFDMNSFQYIVEDSLMYFAKAQQSGVIKLVFESFSGSSTGIATFTTELISPMGIGEVSADAGSIYPNPTSGELNLLLPGNVTGGIAAIYDLSGRILQEWTITGTESMKLDVSHFTPGTYVLMTKNNSVASFNKVILVK